MQQSRLDADLTKALRKQKITIAKYREAVKSYRHAQSKAEKWEMEELISKIKMDFSAEISGLDLYDLNNKVGLLANLRKQISLFEETKEAKKIREDKTRKAQKDVDILAEKIEDLKNNKMYQNAFEWRFEFPEVLNDKGDFLGFDVVVGNPPYGIKFSDQEKNYYLRNFIKTSGEIEVYSFFIERALGEILKEGGVFSFITTNTIYYLDKFADVRKKFFIENTIISLLELEKNVFSDAPDIVPAIYCVQKKHTEGHVTYLYKAKSTKVIYDLDEFIGFSKLTVPQSIFKTKNNNIFSLETSPEKEGLLTKLDSFDKLKLRYKVVYGIKTGDNKKFVQKKVNEVGNWRKCASSAENIKKYNILWNGDFLNVVRELAGLGLVNYEQPKILIQYIRKISMKTRLVCALDIDGEYYPLNNFSFVISNNDFSLVFLTGLLNSNLMNWYFQNTFVDYNIKPKYIEQLPLPSMTNCSDVERLCLSIFDLKKANPQADTSTLEKQIDQLVYALYGLTAAEIAIIEKG